MSTVLYQTKLGDRWDTVCFSAYGTINKELLRGLVEANPTLPISKELPSGIKLNVPIVTNSTTINADDLPPWKR